MVKTSNRLNWMQLAKSLAHILDFPGSTVVKDLPTNAGDPWVSWEDSLEQEMATRFWTCLPGKSHRQKGLVGSSPGDCKELDITWVCMCVLVHTHARTHTDTHTEVHIRYLTLTVYRQDIKNMHESISE